MRYRPFNSRGLSTSALTLSLPAGALREGDAFKLVCVALEHGINSFEIVDGDEAAAGAMRQAMASVGRSVVVLTLRISSLDGAANLVPAVRTVLRATEAQYLDVLMLDETCPLGAAQLAQVEDLKAARLVRMAGMAADGALADQAIAATQLDVLAPSYNIRSGWPERNRIKTATGRGMTIVGRNFHIDMVREAKAQSPKGLSRLFRKPNLPAQHAYDFMKTTPNWTPDQISLAFALTEPSLATVQVETTSAALLEKLAGTVERELPPSVSAQIELARVASISHVGAA